MARFFNWIKRKLKSKYENEFAGLIEVKPPFDLDTLFQVAEMQGWLTEQSVKGLFLEKANASFFYFRQGVPQTILYRIEPIIKYRYANGYRRERFAGAGWEHTCSTEEFSIFRAWSEAVLADPQEDAPALLAIYKERMYESLLYTVLGTVVCSILIIIIAFSGLKLSALTSLGIFITIFCIIYFLVCIILISFYFLYTFIKAIAFYANCRRICRQLKEEEQIKIRLPSKFMKPLVFLVNLGRTIENSHPWRYIPLFLFLLLGIIIILLIFR